MGMHVPHRFPAGNVDPRYVSGSPEVADPHVGAEGGASGAGREGGVREGGVRYM